MLPMNKKIFSTFAFLLIAGVTSAYAQPARVLTAQDYARAEKMLIYNTSPLVDRGAVRPNFLADGRFWYMALTPNGNGIRLDKSVGRLARDFSEYG